MERTFTYYTDPGHGWIKVPVKLLRNIGCASEITIFSYYRNGFAYLEEDCDAGTFIEKMKGLNITPKFVNKHTDRSSRIRNYQFFNSDFYKTVEPQRIEKIEKIEKID